MKNKQALLIIDAQVNMFDEDFCVYNAKEITENIRFLIQAARKTKTPVIFIRNNGEKGDPDIPGTPGWKIHPSFVPIKGETIIDKQGPDAFAGTNLQEELKSKDIEKLIIAGMQTEVCIETSVHRSKALGYQVIVAEDAHTTFDFDDQKATDTIQKANEAFKKIVTLQKAKVISFS